MINVINLLLFLFLCNPFRISGVIINQSGLWTELISIFLMLTDSPLVAFFLFKMEVSGNEFEGTKENTYDRER
jgi:hypothetical protein